MTSCTCGAMVGMGGAEEDEEGSGGECGWVGGSAVVPYGGQGVVLAGAVVDCQSSSQDVECGWSVHCIRWCRRSWAQRRCHTWVK